MQKPIPGFPGYEITDDGRVWSVPRISTQGHKVGGCWLKPRVYRYLCVVLLQDCIAYPRGVHRLVLETFVGPRPEGMEACHNNGNPLDNRLENLRWDTRAANQLDAVRHGTQSGLHTVGESHGMHKLTEKQVNNIMEEYFMDGATQKDLAVKYGTSRSLIGMIANRDNWGHLPISNVGGFSI